MGCFSQKGLCYNFWILHRLLRNKNIRIAMERKNFMNPPYPPKKADFGRTKAEIGCLSQKGFGILHGLLNKKNIRKPMKMIFGRSPLHPQLTQFWLENGEIWWNRLCRHACQKLSTSANGGLSGGSYGHGSEDPHRPYRKLLFPWWYFSLRRSYLRVLKHCMGF